MDLLRLRLRNQRLTGPPLPTPEAVVAWFGAVQAQDYSGARWAVALRTRAATERAVDRACDAGAIIRTHVLRPTWHLVLPADLRWMLALTAPRVNQAMTYYNRVLELDDRVFGRANAVLARALAGKQLTRTELGRALVAAKIAAPAQRLGHLLMRAELDAVICSGARRGKQATYALVDERCPRVAPIDRDDALGRLATRYFTAHGPARVADFAWWSGLTTADARRAIAIAALPSRELDGEPHHLVAAPTPRAAATLHLLPNFDEYLVAYKHRAATLHDAIPAALGPPNALLAKYVVVLDGRVVGAWRRTLGPTVTVTTQLAHPLTRPQRAALARAVTRYGEFLERPARLSLD